MGSQNRAGDVTGRTEAAGDTGHGRERRQQIARWVTRTAVLALVAGTVGMVYSHVGRTRTIPSMGDLDPRVRAELREGPSPEEAAFRREIEPLLKEFDARNRDAAECAVRFLRDRIAIHRAGVKPFTEDISSWGTRFGLIGRYAADLWDREINGLSEADSAKNHMGDKFRTHVLSEKGLRADLEAVLLQFNADLEASKNRLYSDIRGPLSRIRVTCAADDPGFANVIARTQTLASEMAKGMAPDTLVAGLASFSAGCLAMDAGAAVAERVIVLILARLGTQLAITGVEAGGATASAMIAGGSGGSIVGPEGTVAGAIIGFIVGALVDMWMSDHFERQLADQCYGFLDALSDRLLKGDGSTPGLEKAFGDAVGIVREAQRNALVRAAEEMVR